MWIILLFTDLISTLNGNRHHSSPKKVWILLHFQLHQIKKLLSKRLKFADMRIMIQWKVNDAIDLIGFPQISIFKLHSAWDCKSLRCQCYPQCHPLSSAVHTQWNADEGPTSSIVIRHRKNRKTFSALPSYLLWSIDRWPLAIGHCVSIIRYYVEIPIGAYRMFF